MVLLWNSVTSADSVWIERVACTLGNLCYPLCHVENVLVARNLQELWEASVCMMEMAIPAVSNGSRNCLF